MEIRLCDYGCGKEAVYSPRKGKPRWSCEDDFRKCPIISTSKSKKMKEAWADLDGLLRSEEVKDKRRVGVKRSWDNDFERKEILSQWNRAKWEDKKSFFHSREVRAKIGENTKKSWDDPNSKFNQGDFGEKVRKGILEGALEHYKRKYAFFYKVEEIRQHSKTKEIQVHCKNNKCKNSKEQGGWFTPTRIQLSERIRQLEKEYGNDGCYFYCSKECRNSCDLYNVKSDPYKDTELPYTSEELQTWRIQVKDLDNGKCQMCESTKNIHVHHIIPVKLEPFFALDPVNGICLCKECHYKIGHPAGTECSTGNLASKTCQEKRYD